MTRLEGKTAIVTGAAAGQGRHIAERFAAEGAAVVIADVDVERGPQAARTITDSGGKALFELCDVGEESSWANLVSVAHEKFGPIDICYNNAAIFLPQDRSVLDMSVDTWDRVMAVNVRGTFLGCKHVLPDMLERGSGSIVNVASIRAYLGTSAPQDAYATSKGAVVALTKSLAVEFAPRGIRVNVICPGTVETEMAPLPDEAARLQRIARYPIGRFGTPTDVAGAAIFLSSDESSWITGVVLPVDGGTSVFYV